MCQYRTGVRGNVDKHIRTVHDLIVVTKHTVQLKMKYPDFSSGDVITKDGHLVATAQERKALQQAPAMEKDINLIGEIEKSIQKYKQVKRNNTIVPVALYPTVKDGEIPTEMVNLTQTSVANNTMAAARDLASLSNYVYVHGDAVMSSLNVPVEAQDLRLLAGTSAHAPEQQQMYSLGNGGDLFIPSKFEYQEQL